MHRTVEAIGLRLNAAGTIGLLDDALTTAVTTLGGAAIESIRISEFDDIVIDSVAVSVNRVDMSGATSAIDDAAQSELITRSAGHINTIKQTLYVHSTDARPLTHDVHIYACLRGS